MPPENRDLPLEDWPSHSLRPADAVAAGERLANPPSAGVPPESFNAPLDFRCRAQLTEWMDEPCSRDTMRACLRDLAKVNRWFLAYRPVLNFLEQFCLRRSSFPLRILDVGCGYGDTLRRIEGWAQSRNVPVELTGLDLNPDTIAIAAEATAPSSRIRWTAANIFHYTPPDLPHLVVSSLFTHHLPDADVIRFLGWMEQNALLGWVVNDLSRAPVPYHLFGWFARLAGLHPFVQHDGPVSIARAFASEDWVRLGIAAGLREKEFTVRAYTPARLCVSRSKPA